MIDSKPLALHFEHEIDRMWRGADLGVNQRLQRKRLKQRQRCGMGLVRDGDPRPVRPAAFEARLAEARLGEARQSTTTMAPRHP